MVCLSPYSAGTFVVVSTPYVIASKVSSIINNLSLMLLIYDSIVFVNSGTLS